MDQTAQIVGVSRATLYRHPERVRRGAGERVYLGHS
jgi:transposase-like protein